MKEIIRCIKNLIELIPDAAIVVDKEGIVVSINSSLASMFGCSESVVGETIDFLIPLDHKEEHRNKVRSYMSNPEVREFGKILNISSTTSDGRNLHVDVMLMPILTEKSLFAMAVVRDVDAIKKIADKMKSLIHKLEESSTLLIDPPINPSYIKKPDE